MNRFEKYLLDKARELGEGMSRKAWEAKNRVFKTHHLEPHGKLWGRMHGEDFRLQLEIEKEIYETIKEYYPELLQVFPSPIWMGRVMQVERADILGDLLHEVDYMEEEPDAVLHTLYDEGFCIKHLAQFVEVAENEGWELEDILFNWNNLGVIDDRVVILDWGLCSV